MNITWKHLFSNIILKRGEAYYRNGDVTPKKTAENSNTKTFYVQGTDLYIVKIAKGKDSIKSMQCDCPYAKSGARCKHMAAALFWMEKNGDLAIGTAQSIALAKAKGTAMQKPTKVFPFAQSKDAASTATPYQYYRFDKITEACTFYQADFETAKALIRDKRVRIQTVYEGFPQYLYRQIERECTVVGVYLDTKGKEHSIRVSFRREKLLYTDCSAPNCPEGQRRFAHYNMSTGGRVCAHLTALLLLAQDYVIKKRLGDATDLEALRLIRECREDNASNRKIYMPEQAAAKPIHLEPRLDVEEDGQLNLTFKVGADKLYIIKDLSEFVKIVEANGEMQLGTKNRLSFAAASFDAESLGLYHFLKNEVKAAGLRGMELYKKIGQAYEEIKSTIPLYGRALDEFFVLMEDRHFPFVQKTGRSKRTGEAGCADKSPNIALLIENIQDSDGNFDGIRLSGEIPILVEGAEYQYFFEDTSLNRVVSKDARILEALMRTNDYGSVSFKIGRRNLSEFYYKVLPALEEIAKVQIQDARTIAQYLYPEPEFSFFLDANENVFTCTVKVQYKDQVFELTKGKMTDGAQAKDEVLAEYRDLRAENEMLAHARGFFPYQNDEGALCCDEEEQQYRVLESGVDFLLKLGEVHATDRFQRVTIRRKPQITVGVRMESDLLKLKLSSTDLTDEELIDLLNSYRSAKRYHRLRNGDFIQMEADTMEELASFMSLSKAKPGDFVKGDMKVPAYRALYLDKVLEKNELFYAKRDHAFKHLVKEFKTVADSEYEVPESLQHVMRGYQEFGYKWLRTVESYRFGGILADDMGLGKTLQVISVLLAAKQEGRLEEALIVTPASLVYNWKEEFAKFAPELSIALIAGNKEEREEQIKNAAGADILITSYDLLKRDILFYADKTFSYQIIDEAQYIKTHTTAAAKSVKAVNSRVRFALTGTPIENRLSELWSIFDFLMPGFLYGYEKFRKELEMPIVRHKDEAAMNKLKRLVEPFILRRLKQEVLSDLPDKNEEICYVHFDKKQQNLYDGQVLHMKQMIEKQSDEMFQKNKMAVLAEITKIRQICCDPSLCFENYDGESAKRETCMELLKSAMDGGHKILVFSQFRSLLELLEKDLQNEGIAYFKITGETKKEDRVTFVNRFNQDETPIFLISLKAGGTGLNLTGADIVIHFDPWWNLAAQNQATDRAHRIGQTKAVSVYKLIVKDTIEEKILKMQEEKSALADEILSGHAGGLMRMSRAELLELL